MIVLAADRAEFAAKRNKTQADAIRLMEGTVRLALVHFDDDSGWYVPILDDAHELFDKIVTDDGGDPASAGAAWRRLANDLRTSLTKTSSVKAHSSELIATFVTGAVINVATIEAAHQGEEAFALEWISMHDDKVRTTHREADGQTVRAGRMFQVGGSRMRYPGDTRAPIGEWINCRCTLAPVAVPQRAAASVQTDLRPDRGVAMTTETVEPDTTEADPMMPIPWHGVLAPEGVWSGDKRMFKPGSLSHRTLPLPLTYQKVSDEGHKGSVAVGSIDYVHKDEAGLLHAGGTFLQSPEADEVIGLIAHFGRYGVSVDADDAEFDFDDDNEGLAFSKARVAGASIVAIPAFQEAYVMIGEDPNYAPPSDLAAALAELTLDEFDEALEQGEPVELEVKKFGRGPGWITDPVATKRIHDYWTVPGQPGFDKIAWGTPGDFNRCRVEVGQEIAEEDPATVARFINQICSQWHHDATGFWPGHAPTEQVSLETPDGDAGPAVTLVASVGVALPATAFRDPEFTQVTPITITEDGHISGHLAAWGTCHTGFDKVCVQPPPSANDYAYFLTGEVVTDEGPVAVGNICMGGGHAPHRMRINKALSFYDSTSTVVADVACGEDDHGIWISGMTRELTPEQERELRASSLSGDWRKVRLPQGESMELIAALCVNSPGFPVARVGTYSGEQVSLVASAPPCDGAPETQTENLAVFAELVAMALEERQARRAAINEIGEELGV